MDWITLKCCCGPSVRDLWRASGEVWERAGGEAEQGKDTRFGGWGSLERSRSVFPVLGIKTWGENEKKGILIMRKASW